MPVKSVAFSELSAEFLGLQAAAGNAPATRAKYRQVIRVMEALGIETTEQLTTELITRFLAARPSGQSTATARSLLISLRAICSYAEARRYVAISPFRIRKLSQWVRVRLVARKRHQSREEIRRVLDLMAQDVADKQGWAQWRARRLYALTATVAYTALRAREAQFLWVEDIDLEARVINLVPRTAHGRLKTESSAQPIVIPAALAPILADWLTHRLDHPEGFRMPPAEEIPWMFPGSRRIGPWHEGPPALRPVRRLGHVARRAGVEGMTFQSLRRSWATAAEARGVPGALIQRQLRHTTERTSLEWYRQRDMKNLHDAIDGFEL